MKNLSVALNVVLTIAVVFLYYKVYSTKDISSISSASVSVPVAESSIVFVNSDSLLDNYPFFMKLKTSMEKKQDSIESILKSRGKQLENDIKVYQEKGATMTEQERQSTEEVLGKRQQELMQYKQEMTDELARAEEALNDTLHNNLISTLKKYNKDKKYHFILGYQKGSGILLASDSLDITKQIIEELNKEKAKK
ncbi:MAG: OmpH family outer membrane protein [Bacteroidia bacterium]